MFYNGSVKAVDALALNYHGRILFVSRLEADFVVRFEKDSFESCFMRHCKTHEAIVAVVYLDAGRENHYIALAEFRLHRIAYDPDGKGIGVM